MKRTAEDALRELFYEGHYWLHRALRPGQRYVFVLSHMRGCTTLLTHLLGSNPEIDGYQESKFSYPRRRALKKLVGRMALDNRRLPARFVLDKLLHNRLTLCDEILRSDRVSLIFLLRRPEATLRSLLAMLEGGQTRWEEADAVDYYASRLAGLEELARRSGGLRANRPLYLDAEGITDHTRQVFDDLESFLGLRHPLEETYSLFPKSGAPGFGDGSENLRSGRIQRQTTRDERPLSPESVERAADAYKRCRETLRNTCD